MIVDLQRSRSIIEGVLCIYRFGDRVWIFEGKLGLFWICSVLRRGVFSHHFCRIVRFVASHYALLLESANVVPQFEGVFFSLHIHNRLLESDRIRYYVKDHFNTLNQVLQLIGCMPQWIRNGSLRDPYYWTGGKTNSFFLGVPLIFLIVFNLLPTVYTYRRKYNHQW